jgi:hypothetical protein
LPAGRVRVIVGKDASVTFRETTDVAVPALTSRGYSPGGVSIEMDPIATKQPVPQPLKGRAISLTDATGSPAAPVTLRRKADPGVILAGESSVSRARVFEQGSSVARTRRRKILKTAFTGLLYLHSLKVRGRPANGRSIITDSLPEARWPFIVLRLQRRMEVVF